MIAFLKRFLNSTIGTVGMKPINAMIDEVKSTNLINYGSAIKSIQRGRATVTEANTVYRITINSIEPSKSIVLLDGVSMYSTTTAAVSLPTFYSLTATALEVISSGSRTGSFSQFSWQVIEFY